MLRFVFLALLALNVVSGLGMFPQSVLQHARMGEQELCQFFCGEGDYPDYFLRSVDEKLQPRFLCGLCKKKLKTTTPPPTGSSASTTSSSTTSSATSTTKSSTSVSTTTTTTPKTTPTTTPKTTTTTPKKTEDDATTTS